MFGEWKNFPGHGQKFVRKDFQVVTIEEFERMVRGFEWDRKIRDNHIHHTFRPNRADFARSGALGAMVQVYGFHTGINAATGQLVGPKRNAKGQIVHRDWSDFGPHVMAFPDGAMGICRDWNRPPASATGHNGSSAEGPYMVEILADLRKGREFPPTPQQWESVARMCAVIDEVHKRPPEAMKFHNEMQSTECPGDISKSALIEATRKAMATPWPAPAATLKPLPSPVPEIDAIQDDEPGDQIDWDMIQRLWDIVGIAHPAFMPIRLLTGLSLW